MRPRSKNLKATFSASISKYVNHVRVSSPIKNKLDCRVAGYVENRKVYDIVEDSVRGPRASSHTSTLLCTSL